MFYLIGTTWANLLSIHTLKCLNARCSDRAGLEWSLRVFTLKGSASSYFETGVFAQYFQKLYSKLQGYNMHK